MRNPDFHINIKKHITQILSTHFQQKSPWLHLVPLTEAMLSTRCSGTGRSTFSGDHRWRHWRTWGKSPVVAMFCKEKPLRLVRVTIFLTKVMLFQCVFCLNHVCCLFDVIWCLVVWILLAIHDAHSGCEASHRNHIICHNISYMFIIVYIQYIKHEYPYYLIKKLSYTGIHT